MEKKNGGGGGGGSQIGNFFVELGKLILFGHLEWGHNSSPQIRGSGALK